MRSTRKDAGERAGGWLWYACIFVDGRHSALEFIVEAQPPSSCREEAVCRKTCAFAASAIVHILCCAAASVLSQWAENPRSLVNTREHILYNSFHSIVFSCIYAIPSTRTDNVFAESRPLRPSSSYASSHARTHQYTSLRKSLAVRVQTCRHALFFILSSREYC